MIIFNEIIGTIFTENPACRNSFLHGNNDSSEVFGISLTVI